MRRGAEVSLKIVSDSAARRVSICLACFGLFFGVVLARSVEAAVEHAPGNTVPPVISGTPKAGETLTATKGSWTEEPTAFSYRWEVCFSTGACLVRQDSASASYLVRGADADHQIKLTVTASNGFGSSSAGATPMNIELSWHFGTGPPRVEKTSFSASREQPPWSTSGALGIGVSSGMCVGEGRPYLSKVVVRERGPSSKLPFPSVVITTSVTFPSPTMIVGTVHAGEVSPACAGVGIGLGRHIRLRRPSARLHVYDGRQSPPRLVLEPAKILHWRNPRIVGPRSIEISVPFSGCAGMSISAHPVYRRGRVIITVYGEWPTAKRPRPCQRGYGVEHLRLNLKEPVDGMELLDGSFGQPRLRQRHGAAG
ncbi:MAG: hypothetical protein JST08_00455 [Actinobacteria bacterium]|nr:hypothetical protein [Actinomycetota bacterium]